MMKVRLKKILCATDFSDFSNHTLRYGVSLAREFGAKLYVCHVIDLPSAAIYGEITLDHAELQNRFMADVQEQLDRLIGGQPIDWEPLIETGRPVDKINAMVGKRKIDLVIAATHGRSGLKRLLLGSVTERLMHTLRCPLLIVNWSEHEFVSPEASEIRLQRILVACDFSPDSRLAFEYGLSLAQEFQSELHLVHVIEPPVYKDFVTSAHEPGEDVQQVLYDRLNEKLTGMVPAEALNWCRLTTTLLSGNSFEELREYAVKHDVDLIALGIRGHSLVETMLVGSTTDRVVRSAPCPVLTVCPPE